MPRLLLSFLILAGIVSCKKDKDAAHPLVGKWKQIEYFEAGTPTACDCWKPAVESGASLLEFNANGTYKYTPPLYVSAVFCPNKYSVISDTTVNITWGCLTPYDTTITHQYAIEGDQLILHWTGVPAGYKVKFKKVGF